MRFAVSLCLTLTVIAAHADSQLQYSGGRNGPMQVLVSQGRASFGGADSQMLYASGSPDITVLDHSQRQYSVFDPKSVSAIGQQNQAAIAEMKQAQAQMKAQLATLPKEQRAMLEQMLARQVPQASSAPAVQTLQQRGTARVGQWSCTVYDVLENGQPVQQICAVPPRSVGMSDQDFATLASAVNASRKMTASLPGTGASGMVDLNQIGGVPVQIRFLATGEVSTLSGISNAPIAAGRLQVPQGYARRQLGQ